MVFGKKQPEMFDAFRQKSDKPDTAKRPGESPPEPKPVNLKPPVPVPGRIKPPVNPAGAPAGGTKRFVPELKEAKPVSSKPATPKPAESTPAEPPKTPEPKLFEDKSPAPAPSAPASAAATPKPAPMPGVTRPASAPVTRPATPSASASRLAGTASGAAGASALGGLRDSKDVHVVELGKKPEVVFGLSYHALTWAIVIAFAAVLLVVVLAVTVFRGGSTPEKTTGAPLPGRTTGGGPTEPSQPTKPAEGLFPPGTYYSVQVLTVKNEPARLKELDAVEVFLKEQRVGEVVRKVSRRGDLVSLFAGAFLREHKADAEVLAKRIQKMVYHTRYEFKDAQVVTTQ